MIPSPSASVRRPRRGLAWPTRRALLVAIAGLVSLPLAWACFDQSSPTGYQSIGTPSPPPPPSVPIAPPSIPITPPPKPSEWPAPDRPATVFHEVGAIYSTVDLYHFHQGTPYSRFVLYEDGAVALQFISPRFGFGAYPGWYTRQDSVVSFRFVNSFIEWSAIGRVRGDSLLVRYNDYMLHSDFADGSYVREAIVP
jgi:hypothetical protein